MCVDFDALTLLNVRQQCHLACQLNCTSKFLLILKCNTGVVSWNNTTVLRHKLLQDLETLVVNERHFCRLKGAFV